MNDKTPPESADLEERVLDPLGVVERGGTIVTLEHPVGGASSGAELEGAFLAWVDWSMALGLGTGPRDTFKAGAAWAVRGDAAWEARLAQWFRDAAPSQPSPAAPNDAPEKVAAAVGDRFVQGYGCALATLARAFGETGYAKMLANEAGFTLKTFTDARVEKYDLKEIRRAFKVG